MKKTALILHLIFALLTLSGAAGAREAVPIIDYNDVAIFTGTGKPITSEQAASAITSAALAQKWDITRSSTQNLLSATLHVHNKHTVVVSIPYSPEKFSIKYGSSVNMKYQPADSAMSSDTATSGQPSSPAGKIHPYYNRWVQNLLQSIKQELNKL
ncbi:hypothetical protein EGT07_00225 [Herbaspirillum sp. HC18]|nr:hypothetical protein EGT07_00225 [Herbaspirillum sp. HC18]